MTSAAHEVDEVDEEGFAYSAVPLHDPMVSHAENWCVDDAIMTLDTGCAKAMCALHAFHHMKQGLSDDQVELLPDASTFNFVHGQQTLARKARRMWFS